MVWLGHWATWDRKLHFH